MSFSHDDLARLRPYLFHLTARENLNRIRQLWQLQSAAQTATHAGRLDVLQTPRRRHVAVLLDGEAVLLRDQAPLHKGNMQLEAAWSFERFVGYLNERVFFWPGDEYGPISYGVRHFERYEEEAPVILRVPFVATLEANPNVTPLFCRYNSGSPRWSRGKAAPRGGSTFVTAAVAPFRASQVVEVTVPDTVSLPSEVMIGPHPCGPWEPF